MTCLAERRALKTAVAMDLALGALQNDVAQLAAKGRFGFSM